MTALSARMNRKHLLVALMAVFIAGNLMSAAAQDVQLLIATRLITAVAHAVIASVGAALAISLVDKAKQARAISAVFGGLTASLVVGVPLCTCIGQHLGWRAAFLAVAVISALALVGDLLFLPNGPGSPGVPLRGQVARLADKQLVLPLVLPCSASAARSWPTPTSLRSWRTSAASAPAPSACCSSGSAQPPRWATSSPDPSPTAGSDLPCWGLVLLAATLSAMTATGQTRSGAVITLLMWGAAASGIAPIFQNFLYHSAPDIPEMAGALAASSINVGVAAGSAVCGQIVAAYGVHDVTWIGGLVVLPRWPSPSRRCAPAHTRSVQRQHEAGSDLDAQLILITVPELLRLLRDTVIPRPGETSPTGCTGPPGGAATSTVPAKPTIAGMPTPRQHHDHNKLQLPTRQDIEGRRLAV